MDLFDEFGHLTKNALQLMINGEPDELQRLEIAEHLSFCDECIAKYTACLEQSALMSPEKPLETGVLAKIKSRAHRIFMNRYATIATAACFAIVLWTTGIFTPDYSKMNGEGLQTIVIKTNEFSQKTEEFTRGISEGINNFFDTIDWKGVLQNGKK